MKPRTLHAFLAIVFLTGISLAGFTARENFTQLVICFALAALVYIYCIARPRNWQWWLAVGLVARVLLIPAFPNLSDDIYRFFWDGHLTLMGMSPFAMTPTEAINGVPGLPESVRAVYPLLNSPDYYSVYPLFVQGVCAAVTFASGGDLGMFAILLKVVFVCCECGSLYLLLLLLKQMQREEDILIYALNPLIILELCGNLHFEVFVILFLLLMYFFVRKNRTVLAGVAMSMAVATKILPVILAPFLLRRMPVRRFMLFAVVVAIVSTLLFLPVLTGDPAGFVSSLELYFRRFEFNASIYNLARSAGIAYYGYNAIAVIGPILAVCTAFVLAALWLGEKRPSIENFPRIALFALSVYLLFATTVHPWYLCPLVAFCALTTLRYPIAWSLAAFLTYVAYIQSPPEETWWVIGIEYAVVFGCIVWDCRVGLKPTR